MHITRRSVSLTLILLLVPAMLLGAPGLVGAGTLFGAATDYSEFIPCMRVAAFDYSGEGAVDLMVTPTSINWYMTVYGSDTGTFSLGSSTVTTGVPSSIAFGFFNGDEDHDMALACAGNNCVAVHINDGAGGFSGASNYPTNMTPVWVAAGDLNDDGYDDLVTANSGDDSVTVLMNDQDGTFTATNYAVFVGGPRVQPSAIALGDFDGDADLDIAVALELDGTFWAAFNDGTGAFSFGMTRNSAGLAPVSIVSADFNDDGYDDVAVANYLTSGSDNSVCVWLGGAGDSHTDFVGPDWHSVGDYLTSIAFGDFDADGTPDLAVADKNDDQVSVLLGDGEGDFGAPDSYTVGDEPVCIAAADFDSSGACDLATANNAGCGMSVLLSQASPPTIVDVTLNLEVGWNMVSVPVEADDMTVGVIFPDAEAVYTWDPGTKSYIMPTTIDPELSYWVAMTSADTVTVTGEAVTTWTYALSLGWNMAGSVYGDPVDMDDLVDDPAGSVQKNAIYHWNPETKSYDGATQIQEGLGYWMACTDGCDLTITAPEET